MAQLVRNMVMSKTLAYISHVKQDFGKGLLHNRSDLGNDDSRKEKWG